jgi:hypothetical protein
METKTNEFNQAADAMELASILRSVAGSLRIYRDQAADELERLHKENAALKHADSENWCIDNPPRTAVYAVRHKRKKGMQQGFAHFHRELGWGRIFATRDLARANSYTRPRYINPIMWLKPHAK